MLEVKSICINLSFFWLTLFILRLPSLFFSWWYGDENVYLAIGHAIAKGQLLYVQAWDNKPPLIYLIYAGIYTIFKTQLWAYKLFNLLLALWEISIFHYVIRDIFRFSKKQIFWTTLSMSILLAIVFEGTILNAENIFVPLVLTGFYFVYTELNVFEKTEEIHLYRLLIGGLFWFLASFTKIHAFLEILVITFIISLILIRMKLSTVTNWQNLLLKVFKLEKLRYFILLPLLPIVLGYITLIIFYSTQGYQSELLYSLVGFSKNYVETSNIPIILGFKLEQLTGLQIRTFLFGISLLICTYLFWKKCIQKNSFILGLWLSITVFTVLIPERNYGHYLLQLLPPGLIFVTSLISYLSLNKKSITEKLLLVVSASLGAQTLLVNFPTTWNYLWNYYDHFDLYFGQFVEVTLGKRSLKEWQKSYKPLTYEAQELLPPKIKKLTTPKDKIFLYGNLSEIYAMSDRVNGVKWIVAYYIVDSEKVYQNILFNKIQLIVVDSDLDSNKKFTNLISSNYKKEISIQQYDFWIYK